MQMLLQQEVVVAVLFTGANHVANGTGSYRHSYVCFHILYLHLYSQSIGCTATGIFGMDDETKTFNSFGTVCAWCTTRVFCHDVFHCGIWHVR